MQVRSEEASADVVYKDTINQSSLCACEQIPWIIKTGLMLGVGILKSKCTQWCLRYHCVLDLCRSPANK